MGVETFELFKLHYISLKHSSIVQCLNFTGLTLRLQMIITEELLFITSF